MLFFIKALTLLHVSMSATVASTNSGLIVHQLVRPVVLKLHLILSDASHLYVVVTKAQNVMLKVQ